MLCDDKSDLLQDISTTHRDSIFFQSSFPKQVWDLAVKVMDLFEKAKLKDQKLRSAAANTKPDFKQQYLAPIRCLESSDQCMLLEKCVSGHLSLKEMKSEAENLKRMYVLKKSFIKLTNTRSWEDATSKFPQCACESQLKRFLTLDMGKEIPKPFLDFCKRAKSLELCDANANDEQTLGPVVKLGDVIAFAIHAKVSELTGQAITSAYAKFSGADLILLSIKQVCNMYNIM